MERSGFLNISNLASVYAKDALAFSIMHDGKEHMRAHLERWKEILDAARSVHMRAREYWFKWPKGGYSNSAVGDAIIADYQKLKTLVHTKVKS